ncbi:CHAD domain-containing protein [Nocardioides panzhihuensis]|uniref:CHAD domain-containing protein n=1 Tax=Nocardioides panzhihuensis TaxID=860243 RepID=A0A7Z0DK14_9ACTN|nr:CHAD domain-containing protein [Nocardioides panzhihuensis]NYI76883.1 CHAD domain-containing protein [Nocardioides panzhihuensis]
MTHPHEPVGEWWRDQVAALHRWGRLVLRDEDDSVHQMRVTVRRLRSALVTYRPLLDSERTEPLRSELKWLAALLGDVRDAEVLRKRLRRWAAEHGPGPSGIDALRAAIAEQHAVGRARLLPELDGERYRALIAGLAATDGLPWSAGGPDKKPLRKRLRRDWRRLAAAVDKADRATSAGRRREQLHEVRKKAKRTRYTAESLREVFGKDAERCADAARSIQSALGDLNDSVVMIRAIEELPEHDDALREFLEAEEAAADAAEERFASVWKKANRPKVHGWLSQTTGKSK